MSDFITKCVIGEAFLDEIDDYIDDWHDGDSDQSMHEFLGMTHTEYRLWIKDPNSLPQIVIAHRNGEELTEIPEEHDSLPIAARSDDYSVHDSLIAWLRSKNLWG